MKLKDLAGELGLSQTTVSRALNGYPEVSEATRQRVLEAARRFDYRPHASARRLATGRAGAIGAVLAGAPQPAPRSPLCRVPRRTGRAARRGRDRHRALARRAAMTRRSYRRLAAGARVDGVILSSPTVADERIQLLNDLDLPFILHGRTASNIPHAWLDIDNEGAFRQATKYLLDLGHTRIGLINGEARFTYAVASRARLLRSARRRAASPPIRASSASGQMTDEVGYRFAERFLAEKPRPTALLVSSMMMALGAFRAMRAAGLELGRDISMIAHDDVFPYLNADRMLPTMSTTRSSIRAAGARSAELVDGAPRRPPGRDHP